MSHERLAPQWLGKILAFESPMVNHHGQRTGSDSNALSLLPANRETT